MIPAPSFLQSSAWEYLQHALGRKTWRVADALVIRHDLPLGFHYLYTPRPDIRGDFFDEVRTIAAREKSIFLKVDPLVSLLSLQPTTHNLQASIPIQPRETIVMDLTQTEHDLLSAMHEKTRYNIRLAERKGVITTHDARNTTNDFEIFWRLLQKTAARDGFRVHPKEYYKKLLEIRTDDFSNELFFAEYDRQPLATAMVNYYRGETSIVKGVGGVVTYLHGASSGSRRDVMAPHLLHWRIMLEAKRRGYAAYDLWGIDEKHWPGLTRFKKGFGGRIVQYPASVDMIYRPSYYGVYRLLKKIL
ncbi:MAG: peptidoglycan bridge formation glycyltransferase FemA/FemB family protein [Patescibacteria group bacterium]